MAERSANLRKMAEKRTRSSSASACGSAEKITPARKRNSVSDTDQKVKSQVGIPPQKEGSIFKFPDPKQAEKSEEEKMQPRS